MSVGDIVRWGNILNIIFLPTDRASRQFYLLPSQWELHFGGSFPRDSSTSSLPLAWIFLPFFFFFGRLYLLLAKKKFMEVEIKILGAGEMTQWLRVLVALSEDLASTPHTHIVSHSHV